MCCRTPFKLLSLVLGLAFATSWQGRADEPKFYDLGDLPDYTVGGVSYWDNGWEAAKTETIPRVKGGHYNCNNRAPLNDWLNDLDKVRARLGSYERWLDQEYIKEDEQVRKYRSAYDAAVAGGDSKAEQTALENWKDAEASRENIRKAKEDTERRLKEIEKQRAAKGEDVQRICGEGCGAIDNSDCPKNNPLCHGLGQCR